MDVPVSLYGMITNSNCGEASRRKAVIVSLHSVSSSPEMGTKGFINYTKPQKIVACCNVSMREKVIRFPEEMH